MADATGDSSFCIDGADGCLHEATAATTTRSKRNAFSSASVADATPPPTALAAATVRASSPAISASNAALRQASR